MEPFDTFRAEPRRFAVGLPVVFGVSLAVGAALIEVSFPLALAVLLGLQTGGFTALYVPALCRRWHGEGAEGERGGSGET